LNHFNLDTLNTEHVVPAACGFVFADIWVGTGKSDLFHGGIEMFELAATPQRRFKGLTLLVDRDGMEIDVRQSDSSRCRPSGHACRRQQ
jgi:hypothetical protein